MSFEKQALKDADPLHEGMHALDEGRARMRQAVLSAAATTRPVDRRPATIRRLLVTVPAVLILVLAWTTTRLWSPGGNGALQAAQIRLEVRLAEQVGRPGLAPISLPDRNQVLYLHPEVLATNADVAQTGVIEADGRFAVRVELTQAAAGRMRRATEAHVGRPVVILLDGAVAMAPIVRSPIDNVAIISGDYTREAAERLAAGIAP